MINHRRLFPWMEISGRSQSIHPVRPRTAMDGDDRYRMHRRRTGTTLVPAIFCFFLIGQKEKRLAPTLQNYIQWWAAEYVYDNAGNLICKTQGSRVKNLAYEFAGYRLKTVTEPDGRTVTHTYDNNDNLLTQTVSNGVSYRYTYDARNRATGLTATLDGRNFVFGYGYDVYGRMTGLTYPNRTSPVTYSYDELDRLQGIPGFVNSCAYDLDNKLTRMTYANGVANTYSYDVNDRPTTIAAGSLLNLSYGYDPVGNITRINNDYYGYDGLNRLTWYGSSSTPRTGNGMAWNYDGAGNMSSKTKYLNGVSQGVTSFGYDLANRLWSMGSTTYANDAFGARTAKVGGDSWAYTYDGESRLTRVAKNGATQVDCVYDGNGMRVKKVEGEKTTYYVYSGANTLLEYSPTDGTYLYRIYAGKKAVAEEKSGVVKFYHKDHLGSTRVVTNASGIKIAEYKFAPYGEKEVSTGDGTEYGFTDKAEDASTGLKYFGARFYDAEVGRFLTVDPKKDGMNWYAYCNDNPLINIDPDGRSVTKALARGTWEVVISLYLDPKGYDVAADLMRHSLQDKPSDLKLGQNTAAAQKIQDSKEWKDTVQGYIRAYDGDLKQNSFKVNGSLGFKSGDLFLSFHNVSYTIDGKKSGDKWSLTVTIKDTYDFAWNGQNTNIAANTANNLAYMDQETRTINPYDIEVSFTEEVSSSDDSDSEDEEG